MILSLFNFRLKELDASQMLPRGMMS